MPRKRLGASRQRPATNGHEEHAQRLGARMNDALVESGRHYEEVCREIINPATGESISNPTLYRWLNGTQLPDMRYLEQFARAVAKPVSWLTAVLDDPAPPASVRYGDAVMHMLLLIAGGQTVDEALKIVVPEAEPLTGRERRIAALAGESLRERARRVTERPWNSLTAEEQAEAVERAFGAEVDRVRREQG